MFCHCKYARIVPSRHPVISGGRRHTDVLRTYEHNLYSRSMYHGPAGTALYTVVVNTEVQQAILCRALRTRTRCTGATESNAWVLSTSSHTGRFRGFDPSPLYGLDDGNDNIFYRIHLEKYRILDLVTNLVISYLLVVDFYLLHDLFGSSLHWW